MATARQVKLPVRLTVLLKVFVVATSPDLPRHLAYWIPQRARCAASDGKRCINALTKVFLLVFILYPGLTNKIAPTS